MKACTINVIILRCISFYILNVQKVYTRSKKFHEQNYTFILVEERNVVEKAFTLVRISFRLHFLIASFSS